MPWCPKCKNEYKDGVTTCVDCNVDLVESLDDIDTEEYTTIVELAEKEMAEKLSKYLQYSGIEHIKIEESTDLNGYLVNVSVTEKKDATKYAHAFFEVELTDEIEEEDALRDEAYYEEDLENDTTSDDIKEDDTDSDEVQNEYIELSKQNKDRTAYVKKEDQYSDQRSSAFIFGFFALAGYALVLLNYIGKISLINGVLSYGIMLILFTSFLIIGISSYIKSTKTYGEISEEEEMTKKLNEFLENAVADSSFEESEWANSNNELLFYKRTTKLNDLILKEFGELDLSYLDMVVEEFYNSHYNN